MWFPDNQFSQRFSQTVNSVHGQGGHLWAGVIVLISTSAQLGQLNSTHSTTHTHTHTYLLQYDDEPGGWGQLVVYDHVDGKDPQDGTLQGGQGQGRAQGQGQLGGAAVEADPPEDQGLVGHSQGVAEHQQPGPQHCGELPEGIAQQVKLPHQPGGES